jgi:hypothetical protein
MILSDHGLRSIAFVISVPGDREIDEFSFDKRLSFFRIHVYPGIRPRAFDWHVSMTESYPPIHDILHIMCNPPL